MTLLTIIIPSNRTLQNARGSLDSALIYAEKTGCRVIVADNSGDAEKPLRYRNASSQLLYLDTTGYSANQNYMAALNEVDTPFVMPMGDDDEIYSLDRQPRFDLANAPADVAGVRPLTLTWSVENGVHARDDNPLTALHADERIRQFSDPARRNNTIYYSIFRTGMFKSVFALFDAHHPTSGGYCDWAIVACFVACGRILHDPSTLFRYDLGRWASQAGVEQATLSLFRQVGMPDESEAYTGLLRFVDTHGLLMAKDLPISAYDRERALMLNAQVALTAFVKRTGEKPQQFTPEALTFAAKIPGFSSLEQA